MIKHNIPSEHSPRTTRRGEGAAPLFALLLAAALTFTSCNDWLDVKSETEDKEEDLYTRENGFKNALTGIYMDLADEDAYGKRLTMADIDELACLWYCDGFDYNPAFYYLRKHEYTNDYAKESIKASYRKLFNIITQANVLLKNLDEHDEAIRDNRQLKALIQGEAFAIRALCQFDVLRLFGQIPGGQGTRNVKLPYSNTTAINDIPPYYTYEEYVGRLQADISRALELLSTADPVMEHPLGQLNSQTYVTFEDDFFYYRRNRLNYWAVRALQARMDLYLGKTRQAHDEALEVIGATAGGEAVATLSADDNLEQGYFTLPSEQLFSLSKYNLFDYANALFMGSSGGQVTPNRHLLLSTEMLNELFMGTDLSANNRYLKLWYQKSTTNQGVAYATLCKYYFNTNNGTPSMVYQALIPMIRLSEMYLIAMETTTSLEEANTLYYTYMRDHKVTPNTDFFQTLEQVKAEVEAEYRREFIGEGQVFYMYKRNFAHDMPWRDNDDEITESDYIVPLPDTEYEN